MAQKKTMPKPCETTSAIKKRAEILVAGVGTLHAEALELAESVLFMAEKLKESRKLMEKEPLVIDYDNGGGQKGIRENPHYTAFEKLMATYIRSLDQLTKIINENGTEQKPLGVLAELSTIAGRKIG